MADARRRAGAGWLSAAACGIAFLALALGAFRLTAKSIWLDEAVSIQHARGDIGSLVRALVGADPNMGLYYGLLYVWIHLIGESELAVRSLSVAFAALAIPVVYLIGARLFGRPAGIVAALLLAVDEFFVQYAQEARSYSLVVLLVALSSYFFLALLEQPSARGAALYVLTSVLAVYAHYFAAYVLLAQFVTLVGMRRHAAFSGRWMATMGAIVLLSTPEAVVALHHGNSSISWIPKPTVSSPAKVLFDLVGGSRPLLIAYFLACCYAAISLFRSGQRWRYGYVVAWLGIPIMLSFLVSFVQPMFLSRYMIVTLPALVLLVAVGITQVPSRALAVLLILAFVSLSGYRLAAWYQSGSFEDWRSAAHYVLATMRTGDGVAFYPRYASTPFAYYERRDRASQVDDIDPTGRLVQGWRMKRRIWLVVREEGGAAQDPAELRTLELAFARTYRPGGKRTFQGVWVRLFSRAR